MKLVASVILPVLAVFAADIAPAFAETAAPAPQDVQANDTATLPAFVPLSGQKNYVSALQSKSGAAVAARQEAEKISSLFAGMTTGSIDRTEGEAPVETDVPPIVAADPVKPTKPEASSARSIVLASKKSADEADAKSSASLKSAPQVHRAKGSRKSQRIPQKAIAKETRGLNAAASGPANLAAIGQKVSVIDLLTNPALWWQ